MEEKVIVQTLRATLSCRSDWELIHTWKFMLLKQHFLCTRRFDFFPIDIVYFIFLLFILESSKIFFFQLYWNWFYITWWRTKGFHFCWWNALKHPHKHHDVLNGNFLVLYLEYVLRVQALSSAIDREGIMLERGEKASKMSLARLLYVNMEHSFSFPQSLPMSNISCLTLLSSSQIGAHVRYTLSLTVY
jgi:hypothetical protein